MRKAIYLPAAALAGGVVGLGFRLLHLRHGFEPDTGLPVSGGSYGILLAAWCVVTALALFFLSRGRNRTLSYNDAFTPRNTPSRVLLLGGAFLLAVAGFLNIMGYVQGTTDALGQRSVGLPRLVLGILCLAACPAVLVLVKTMVGGGEVNKNVISVPGFAACCWVIANYQDWARDPLTQRYALELLAAVFAMVAIALTAGFGFDDGKVGRTLFFTGTGAAFGLMILGDGLPLYELATDLALFFFLLGMCWALAENALRPPDTAQGGNPCGACPSATAPGGCTSCPSAPADGQDINNHAP